MASTDAGRERWRATTRARALEGHGERRERFVTTSDLEIADLYTPADTAALVEEEALGRPGEFPFTRGVQPTMYRGRFWTMRQYAGFASATQTNERFRYLLEQGQTGLSVAFDLPTQMGYDSDAPMAAGEVGRVGVPVSSIDDMEVLLADLPLDRVTTSMTINATAPILMAMVVAVADRRGIPRDRLGGTVQNDILKEYIARGTYIYGTEASMRLVTDIFAFCAAELPRWNSISISGYHMREAGATAAQELAFTLADAIAYVEGAVARGLDVDAFAGRLSFFFGAWSELFEEVAKFRAARRMWARIMRDRFGATDPRSMMCRFHVQTAGSSLTAQSIDNNVVRTTIQALAAVLGGTQSLHTNARDEALALPTAESARLALRTQQILAHEAGVTETPGPARPARTSWRPSPTSWKPPRRPTSTRSRPWVAPSRPSRRATSSATSRMPRTACSARSRPGSASSWASTASPMGRPCAHRCSASIRPSSASRSSASVSCGRPATRPPARRRWPAWKRPRGARTTSCRPSSRRSGCVPRSVRSAIGCGPCGASTARS